MSSDNDRALSTRRNALLGGLGMAVAGVMPRSSQGRVVPRGVISLSAAVGDGQTNDLIAVRNAFAAQDTVTKGSFTLAAQEGIYLLGGNSTPLVAVQTGMRFWGGALEGTRFRITPESTAKTVLSDDRDHRPGSAAKVELYNLTIDGGSNPNLSALFDLGTGGSIPFGSYGRLDNLMGRDAPNATAFNLSVNIAAVGDIYSINTRDGIVSADGGSGCHIRGGYPYGFSRYGIKLGGIGDNVLNGEGEAPTSDDAVYIYGSRSFVVGLGSHIVAVAPGTTIKRPFVIDTTLVGDWALGPWQFIRNRRDQRFGDFDHPTYSGRATAIGLRSLTDISKNWELDELKGWAVRITSGTAADNWGEIAFNTSDTLFLVATSWEGTSPTDEQVPGVGATYAVAPALCRASGGGFASSKVLTLAEAAIRALFVRVLRVGALRVGSSNMAATITNVMRFESMIEITPVAPQRTMKRVLATPGVRPGDFVLISAAPFRNTGLSIEAEAEKDVVTLFIFNRSNQASPSGKANVSILVTRT